MKTIRWILLVLVVAGGGCASAPKTTLTFHEQVSGLLPDSRVKTVEVPRTKLRIPVSPFASLTQKNVKVAELIETAGGAAVMLRFDPHGLWLLDELTTRSRGNYIVVFLNEKPIAAWLVERRLSLGQFLLEGDFTDDEARQLVDDLNKLAKKPK